jgi:IclR family acetate operon transcriptional repressor
VALSPLTESTITDETTLRADLTQARREGFAVDREEHNAGVFCIASAILVDGGPVGAIGATSRALPPLLQHADVVQHTAEVISHVLNRGV